jgi:cell division protein FtsL
MFFNTIGGILWLFLPIITIYYRKFLYNKYPILFYILVLFSLFTIILFTYLGYIFYPERRAGILKRKRNNNE